MFAIIVTVNLSRNNSCIGGIYVLFMKLDGTAVMGGSQIAWLCTVYLEVAFGIFISFVMARSPIEEYNKIDS